VRWDVDGLVHACAELDARASGPRATPQPSARGAFVAGYERCFAARDWTAGDDRALAAHADLVGAESPPGRLRA
jgi:hypothetical protein